MKDTPKKKPLSERYRIEADRLSLIHFLSHLYPSHLKFSAGDSLGDWLVLIKTPCGQVAFRLSEEESRVFTHLTTLEEVEYDDDPEAEMCSYDRLEQLCEKVGHRWKR